MAPREHHDCECGNDEHFVRVRICTCVHSASTIRSAPAQWCPLHSERMHPYRDALAAAVITDDAGAQIKVCATCARHHRSPADRREGGVA